MNKIRIEEDELYPFYTLRDHDTIGKQFEISDEKYREWKDVMDRFWKMQNEMKELYKLDKIKEDVLFGDLTINSLFIMVENLEGNLYYYNAPQNNTFKLIENADELYEKLKHLTDIAIHELSELSDEPEELRKKEFVKQTLYFLEKLEKDIE